MDALTAHQAAQPGFLRVTLAEALEVAELAWNADSSSEQLCGLAFNVRFKLRAALALLPPPGAPLSNKGGGETVETKTHGDTVTKLKAWITPPAGEGAGEPVKASGLTAEGLEAGSAGVTLFHTTGSAEFLGQPNGDRRFFVVEVDSSGLAAESKEAAATSATSNGETADAPVPEPVDWHFDRMLQQLGGKPA